MGYVVGSLSSIGNASGRVVWGWVSDHVGQFRALLLMTALLATILATWHLSVVDPAAFALWVMAICFCHGANFAICPSLTAQLFGSQHVAPNFGLIFLPYGAVSLVGIALVPRISKAFSTVSYVLSGVAMSAFVSVFLLQNCYSRPRKDARREPSNSSHQGLIGNGNGKAPYDDA